MSYTIRHINFAILFILLSACTGNLQLIKDRPVSPTLASTQTQTIFYLNRSALSYGVFETDAISVSIDVINTTPKLSRDLGDISIEDGSSLRIYKLKRGESTVVHSMPPGKKRVTITAGGQTKYNNELRGVFINKITFDESAVQIQPSGQRVVIYGDSIAAGGNVDSPSAEAWPVLLREHYSVIVEAYGYRTLYDDASTPAQRSEFAARISSWAPDYVWLAIGTNDYDFEQWSAGEFGEAYSGTLDAIHGSNPKAFLFAQSPILRVDESPNSFGDSLDGYREQIEAACLARAGWCVFVDGRQSTFPQLDELDKDGIHLTGTSSTKYAEAVLKVMGK